MTSLGQDEISAIFDHIFATALNENRKVTALELMSAIGLSRTSMNGTYSHVNERRKQHNFTVAAAKSRKIAASDGKPSPEAIIASLRSQLRAEQERSEGYANIIRDLTLQLHARNESQSNVVDGRSRFGSS